MRKITPELTEEISKHTTPETVAKDDAIEVLDYKELRKHIALLSYANKDSILFYRGQKDDYRNQKSGKSAFYPTMYRGDRLDKDELKYRWEKLNKASEIFIKKLRSRYPSKTYIVKRKRIEKYLCSHDLLQYGHRRIEVFHRRVYFGRTGNMVFRFGKRI